MPFPLQRNHQVLRWWGLSVFCGTTRGGTRFCVWCPEAGLCHPLPSFPTTGSLIPGQGHFPQPQVPHATSGNHWDAQMASRLAAKIPRGQKASPSQCQSSASDHGPQWTPQNRPPKHTGAWQPGPMAFRTEGVGGPPASRRPCSLIPVLPAWGSH